MFTLLALIMSVQLGRAAIQAESGQQSALAIPSTDRAKPLTAPLDVAVPVPPWIFRANGSWHLVYELHIANIGSVECTLTRIDTVADQTGATLARFVGLDLNGAVVQPNAAVDLPTKIPPAGFAVVYMWVTLHPQQRIPEGVAHVITMRVKGYSGELSVRAAHVFVNRAPVPLIGPPLKGSDWAAANGPRNDTPHRRGLLTVEGHAYIAERFATDWVRIAPSGDVHTGNAADNRNYPGYGAQVIAVSDGVISAVHDGVPENTPPTTATPITLETIAGNYVTERIGNRLYASYCHLQPGSLRVKRGARVKRGDVPGLLGNSGNSNAPHLHFQVCNANSVLAYEGVPYAFTTFIQENKTFPPADVAERKPDIRHTHELPTSDTLVRFVR
jgi:hypothetical protein